MIIKIDKDKFESNLIHQGADKFAKGSAVFNINEIMLVLDKYTITDMPTKEPTKECKHRCCEMPCRCSCWNCEPEQEPMLQPHSITQCKKCLYIQSNYAPTLPEKLDLTNENSYHKRHLAVVVNRLIDYLQNKESK